MKTKQEIVENWLPRYTQRPVKDFTKYILLTNFSKYVEIFATHFHVPILGEDSNMPSASADGVTIINFGMGSANAATVMDLLSAVKPEAVLFLGKCGGIKKVNKLGDYILPIAAIRGEGTSNDYFHQKSRHCRLSCCNGQFPQPSGITIETTGPERFTRLTVGYGSLTIISKTIYVAYVVWPSIWKQPHCFQLDSQIRFR